MNNEKERIVKIGRATFKIDRRFGGSKSLKELLEKLILQENSPPKTGLIRPFEVSCPWVRV